MTEENKNMLRILRRKQVESRTGLSRSTIYARIAKGSLRVEKQSKNRV